MSVFVNNAASRWKMLALSYAGIVAFAVVFQSVAPVLDLIIAGASLTHGQAGGLMSFFALPGIIASLPAGILADRFGARVVGTASLLLMTAGAALTAVGESYLPLAAGRMIAGAGAFALTVALTRLISSWFAGKELGFAMGVFNTGMPLGTILTLNTLGIIGRTYGWQAALHATTVISLIALVVFFVAAKDPPASLSSVVDRGSQGFSFRRLGTGIWLAGLSWLWINAAGISYLTFGTDYFLSLGSSPAAAGLLTSFLMMGSLFLSPIAGYMIDRGASQKTLIIVGSAMASAIYLLIPGLPTYAYALTISLGIAAALIPVSIFSLPPRILPPAHVGAGFGILSTCLNVGILIGPCMVGIARDMAGGYHVGFIMMAAFSLLSLASIALLRR
ncbi:MAG: hypothetical protein A2X56_07585 [Nitrospirae bacterium GWC2_57_13]|nr:MAG: hypothetical protein A2072_00845 [Nitrospirae bacterium GWC1_57_7]OGW28443.1 MAG: hypothetical protein A2X56_07585 [Nitrospirae bacterium GWC2_57_13]OGW44057.1 MAG: hypothetical protein A2X57_04195 [Nitrospirae bacterium GWD2_57_8]HAR46187.1 hypothetical protein [Nitrospiraceae bacterium]